MNQLIWFTELKKIIWMIQTDLFNSLTQQIIVILDEDY